MATNYTLSLRLKKFIAMLLMAFSLIGCQKDPDLKPKNDGLRLVKITTLSTGGWVANSKKETNFEYDKSGQLVKSSDGYETIKYDYINGRISTVSKFHNSPNSQLSVGSYKNNYDSNGRLTGYESFESGGKLECAFVLSYDKNGNVVELNETYTSSFMPQRRRTYLWRNGNVTSETVTDNGKLNSTTEWIALNAYNPYRLFPPGTQRWWPGLVSVKSLTYGSQEGKLTISKHSSGYPSSVKRSETLSSFTTWYDYAKF